MLGAWHLLYVLLGLEKSTLSAISILLMDSYITILLMDGYISATLIFT